MREHQRLGSVQLGAALAASAAAGLVALLATASPQRAPERPVRQDAVLTAAIPASTAQTSHMSLEQRAAAMLGVTEADILRLDIPADASARTNVQIMTPNGRIVLDLAPAEVRSPNFQLLVQGDDGGMRSVQPGPVQTFRGAIAGEPGSSVAASLTSDGFSARIRGAAGDEIWLEPLFGRIAGAMPGDHALYRGSQVIPTNGVCDNHDHEPIADVGDSGARGLGCSTLPCPAEVAFDADFLYYNSKGSAAAVESAILAVLNSINLQYEAEAGITHVVTAIVVRASAAQDPYSSTDPATLISEVRSYWNAVFPSIPRDLTHLITGRTLTGSTIGRAYQIGAVCTNDAYCFSKGNCCSYACLTDLVAHETGHLWGAQHCNPCVNTTMHTPNQCANHFAQVSIDEIVQHRDTRSCLGFPGPLTLPFSDTFNGAQLDPMKWSDTSTGMVDTFGNGEPSPTTSLNISGSERAVTNLIDLTGESSITVSYWWQRTGGGNSPEPNENLIVEYFDSSEAWIGVAVHLGDGPDNNPYQPVSVEITNPAAMHATFRLRFRGISPNPDSDDFYIDNLLIEGAAQCPGDLTMSGGGGMDGQVNVFDLLELLANWNTDGPGADLAKPTNIVNLLDLLELLALWGACP